jgi:Phosphoinositide 3-kinase family, accessory domain (PIK domain)
LLHGRLTEKEKEFLWKFRYFLKNNPKALTKILRCVDWSDEQQVAIGSDMLSSWQEIDIVDALELLSVDFDHPIVRGVGISSSPPLVCCRVRQSLHSCSFTFVCSLVFLHVSSVHHHPTSKNQYAVNQLETANDDEILSYLLQLVQVSSLVLLLLLCV